MVPDDPLTAYDMHEIIYRIVDNGYFFEIFADFAPNVIVGFARFGGRPAGIVASQPSFAAGAIDCDAADKIARFVRFCDMFNIPLINLHDVPGYWIGSAEEWKGILRHGAKMIYSYIDATVPKITVIVRKSYAGAYTGMCCKDTGADFMFAWPGARVCIVGAETAASIIFAREIKESANPEEMKAKRIGEYRKLFENPYCGAERGFIDDVIMPSDTRKIINKALDLLETKTVVRPPRKYSNINL
jgi:acetyl-CoA carboxylase carboxyltransferase component